MAEKFRLTDDQLWAMHEAAKKREKERRKKLYLLLLQKPLVELLKLRKLSLGINSSLALRLNLQTLS